MMNRRRLGSKDIYLDANSLRVLWKGDVGGGNNYPKFITPFSGYRDGSPVALYFWGAFLADNEYDEAFGGFISPVAATITLTPVVLFTSDGSAHDIYCQTGWDFGGCGDALLSNTPGAGLGGFDAIELPAGTNNYEYLICLSQTVSFAVDANDFVQAYFARDATDVADTLGASCYLFGWKVAYS